MLSLLCLDSSVNYIKDKKKGAYSAFFNIGLLGQFNLLLQFRID